MFTVISTKESADLKKRDDPMAFLRSGVCPPHDCNLPSEYLTPPSSGVLWEYAGHDSAAAGVLMWVFVILGTSAKASLFE